MIVVAVVGILAAVAIPTYILQVRSSKISEVPINLNQCYTGVISYFNEAHSRDDGTTVSNALPTRMNRPLCPSDNNANGLTTNLDGSTRTISPRLYNRAIGKKFSDIGFILTEATCACYSYDTNFQAARGIRPATWFSCLAYTDVDDDNILAIWSKYAKYQRHTGSFQAGTVWRDNAGDDW